MEYDIKVTREMYDNIMRCFEVGGNDLCFHVDNIKGYVERGANPNINWFLGCKMNLLQLLCVYNLSGQDDMFLASFQYLLSLPNINTGYMNEEGRRLIHYLARKSRVKFLKAFFQNSHNNNNKTNNYAPSRYINWFVRQRTPHEIPEFNAATPLSICMDNAGIETASILLQNGAKPNQKPPGGFTPLHIFIDQVMGLEMGEEENGIIRMLLEFRADINTQDDRGNTPLHDAAREVDCESLCLLLLQNGADMQRPNNRGRTPYMIAKPSNKLVFDRWLLYDNCDAFNTVLHPRLSLESAYRDLTPELVGNIRRLAVSEQSPS